MDIDHACGIDTADTVLHAPTGQTWVVAYVEGEHLAWCGWPEGLAKVRDCKLLASATPAQRLQLLQQLACMQGFDSRKTYARRRLEQAETILPSEY